MGYLSLYRKWRPQNFSDIVGQKNVIKTLKNAIKLDRIAHAYLFCGPRGTGKTSTAKILSKSLNCIEGPTINPCGECEVCQKIQNNSSIDVVEIDAASNRGIDEIRELREKVKFFPTEGNYKVYIIDEAHMLTKEAFNALLKTLEEPPEHVIFILATTEPHSLLSTILSRCQRFDFGRLSVENIIERLQFICEKEKVKLDNRAAVTIARNAEGGMRDAISILDQIISYSGGKIDLEDVVDVLGLVEEEILFKMVEIIVNNRVDEGLQLVEKIIKKGKNIQQFINDLINHLRNLLIKKECQDTKELIELTSEQIDKLEEQSSDLETEELFRLINILIKLESDLKQSSQPRILLEMGIIKLNKPKPNNNTKTNTSKEVLSDRLNNSEKNENENKKIKIDKDEEDEKGEDKKDKNKEAFNAEPKVGQEIEQQLSEIKEQWPDVLEYIKNNEPMTHAVLREGNLNAIKDNKIILEFEKTKSFHKDNVDRKKDSIEKVIRKVIGKELKIRTSFARKSNYEKKDNNEENNSLKKKTDRKKIKDKKESEYSEVKENPLVKEVLKVFDGEILKVKEN
jgi:DNA polymerase-3 subunit gamma/tau